MARSALPHMLTLKCIWIKLYQFLCVRRALIFYSSTKAGSTLPLTWRSTCSGQAMKRVSPKQLRNSYKKEWWVRSSRYALCSLWRMVETDKEHEKRNFQGREKLSRAGRIMHSRFFLQCTFLANNKWLLGKDTRPDCFYGKWSSKTIFLAIS